jgi:sugar/nucleoside kinase (ribokinase family)
MTPMTEAFDWLAVGDAGEERLPDHSSIMGGAAARLAAHAAARQARTVLVAKAGADEAGRRLRDALERLHVDLRWLRTVPAGRTTLWVELDGQPERRRVERGADLALRLDELPPLGVRAALTVVSGYSLSVEPARSAALGALTAARARGGRAALLLEAELLWWTNTRMARRVLEPALAAADSVALRAADARVLFGAVDSRHAVRLLSDMGPRLVYLSAEDGSVLLREGTRIHACPVSPSDGPPRDRYAAPAAFWAGLARGTPTRQAAADSIRYAQSIRRAGAPRPAAV